MIIHVIKQDIKNGKPGNPSSCPIANAIKRELGVTPKVYPDIISFNDNEYIATRSVHRFIFRFDNKKPVKPFNFKLDRAANCSVITRL